MNGIRPVSRKRAAELRLRAKLRPQHAVCEVRRDGCTGIATDWHERLSRARGGSITSLSNRVMVCRACHSYITTHPAWAETAGWSLPSGGMP